MGKHHQKKGQRTKTQRKRRGKIDMCNTQEGRQILPVYEQWEKKSTSFWKSIEFKITLTFSWITVMYFIVWVVTQ